MKTCILCNRDLPESEYTRHVQTLGGLQSRCRLCRSVVIGVKRYGDTDRFISRIRHTMSYIEVDRAKLDLKEERLAKTIEHAELIRGKH